MIYVIYIILLRKLQNHIWEWIVRRQNMRENFMQFTIFQRQTKVTQLQGATFIIKAPIKASLSLIIDFYINISTFTSVHPASLNIMSCPDFRVSKIQSQYNIILFCSSRGSRTYPFSKYFLVFQYWQDFLWISVLKAILLDRYLKNNLLNRSKPES